MITNTPQSVTTPFWIETSGVDFGTSGGTVLYIYSSGTSFNIADASSIVSIQKFKRAVDKLKELRAEWSREAVRWWRALLRVPMRSSYEPPHVEDRVARAIGLDAVWRVRR